MSDEAGQTLLSGADAATDAPVNDGAEAQADQAQTDAAESAAGQEEQPADKPEAGEQAEEAAPEPFALALPEGVSVDAEQAGAFEGAMQEWLTANPAATARDALQQAAAWQAGQMQAAADAQVADLAANEARWRGVLMQDKDLGGDRLAESASVAKKGLMAAGGEEILDVLDATGLGSHPAIFKAFHAIGLGLGEARIATGNGGSARRAELSDWYPSMKGGS